MGHERRVRPVSVHAGRRAEHEQAARPRLRFAAVAFALAALAPSLAHAEPPAVTASTPAPFGPGAVLEVLSTGENVTVYVAPMAGTPGAATYGEFKKVGRTPLVIQLPPGSYRVEAEGVDISNGGTDIAMHGAPRQITVSPGKEGMGLVGSLFLGLGITGILGATAILASGTKAGGLDKPAVIIPAYAAGGVLTGAGIGFLVASSTDVEATPAPHPRPRPAAGFALSLRGRF